MDRTVARRTGYCLAGPPVGPKSLVGLLVVVVSIPTVLRILIEMFTPKVAPLANPRMLSFALRIVVLVAVAGFAVGRNNDAFLTCDDFKIAVSDQPTNCAPG